MVENSFDFVRKALSVTERAERGGINDNQKSHIGTANPIPTMAGGPTDAASLSALLDRLDDDYQGIDDQQRMLEETLSRLQDEEARLRAVIREATETGAERRLEQQRTEQAAIMARLEDALLEDDDDDDDDDDDNDDDDGDGDDSGHHNMNGNDDDEEQQSDRSGGDDSISVFSVQNSVVTLPKETTTWPQNPHGGNKPH